MLAVLVGEYLEARGRQVEVLFGFLRAGRLALVSTSLFFEAVTLPRDDAGVVRCRLAGRPAALVQVSERLFLDVAAFALGWPRLRAELGVLAGEELARELIAETPIIRPLEDLKSVILEHSVRAENLFVLGERQARAGEVDGFTATAEADRRFSFAFERGTLDLAYSKDAYARLQGEEQPSDHAPAIEVDTRWKGKSLALPRDGDLPWHDDEVAELAVLGSMCIESHPEDVIRLFQTVFPSSRSSLDALTPSLAVGSVINLWGMALRKTGALDEAIRMLERGYSMAPSIDTELAQQVAYNLGYAKLQTTMTARARIGEREGHELVIANFDLDEKHRAVWTECLGLFEHAATLDPADATAASQISHVQWLLAALDAPKTAADHPPPPPSELKRERKHEREARARAPEKSRGLPGWATIMGLVLLVFVVAMWLRSRSRSTPHDALSKPDPLPSAPSARVPSPMERAETARIAALQSLELSTLATPGNHPCGMAVEAPRPVPRGQVIAPRLGRAPGSGELFGTEYFDATVRQYAALYAPELDVRPATREGIGPVTGAEGPSHSVPRKRPYAATLLVTGWRDPIILQGGSALSAGRIEGRLVIWSYQASRFVCTADVAATNTPDLAIVRSPDMSHGEDDPLNRARLDLIEQAYRKAIPRLRALTAKEVALNGSSESAGSKDSKDSKDSGR